jgi:hypothetical protein
MTNPITTPNEEQQQEWYKRGFQDAQKMLVRPQSGLSAGDREKIVEAICLIQDECTKGPIKLLREVLSSAPTEGWISVEDRLPGELSDVLVSTHDGNVTSGGSFAGGEWFTREGHPWHEQYMSPITHWMPLPEPPLLDRLAGKGK